MDGTRQPAEVVLSSSSWGPMCHVHDAKAAVTPPSYSLRAAACSQLHHGEGGTPCGTPSCSSNKGEHYYDDYDHYRYTREGGLTTSGQRNTDERYSPPPPCVSESGCIHVQRKLFSLTAAVAVGQYAAGASPDGVEMSHTLSDNDDDDLAITVALSSQHDDGMESRDVSRSSCRSRSDGSARDRSDDGYHGLEKKKDAEVPVVARKNDSDVEAVLRRYGDSLTLREQHNTEILSYLHWAEERQGAAVLHVEHEHPKSDSDETCGGGDGVGLLLQRAYTPARGYSHMHQNKKGGEASQRAVFVARPDCKLANHGREKTEAQDESSLLLLSSSPSTLLTPTSTPNAYITWIASQVDLYEGLAFLLPTPQLLLLPAAEDGNDAVTGKAKAVTAPHIHRCDTTDDTIIQLIAAEAVDRYLKASVLDVLANAASLFS